MQQQEDTIDLLQIFNIVKQHKIKLVSIIAVCTILAISIAFILPKQYEATTLIRAKTNKQGGISLQAASALAVFGGGGMATPTQSYIELMKSRRVIEPVIAQLDLPKKEDITAVAFTQGHLEIKNTKGTDLIEVKGKGRTPEEAQLVAQSVVDSFKKLLTESNQTEQSSMLKFLRGRMDVTKQEMEQAEQTLEKFRQQEKVFVPDEQAKAILKKISEFDARMAERRVRNSANVAKLQEINGQLAQQNLATLQFGVTDNLTLQKFKEQIVEKEMKLIGLRQRYTDKHPEVVAAKEEIEQLKSKQVEELGKAVQSGVATLNPAQTTLLSEKITAETELMVGQASENVLQKVISESESEISKLSSNTVTYIGLERQVRVAQEVYAVLVKNYEQARIQETMESMDIQVVDEANLPKKPSAPKKKLIAVIGFVLGSMLSFLYVVIVYMRRPVVNQSPNVPLRR